MANNFILSCESTVDLPYSYMESRNIPVLFYSYLVDDTEYVDDMLRDPEALPRFYQFLDDGKFPKTSQLSQFQYEEFFDELLEKGDVLHVVFGTGMTQSYQNALLAQETMKEKHPDRTLVLVDSLCSCCGYGMLVDYAADMRDNGSSMEEINEWLLANRNHIHHQFYSTDLKFFRRSGRVSGATAMIGTVLGICPIMHLNNEGRIIAYSKVRGQKNAIRTTVDVMEQHAVDGLNYSGKCFISHSNCPEAAEQTREAILARFPKLTDVPIYNIGTIIAAHCGPGTIAAYFLGDDRTAE